VAGLLKVDAEASSYMSMEHAHQAESGWIHSTCTAASDLESFFVYNPGYKALKV
jgi:hypothetical protein